MKELYIKQKVFSLREKFTVKDEHENDVYFIEGSLMKIPKTFSIKDTQEKEVALITKKTFSLLPTFFVEIEGQKMITIKKEFTFLRSRYTIDVAGITVQGNWWDMDFQVLQRGKLVGKVSKKWFSWGDSYQMQIFDDAMETALISLVVALDCVKAAEAALASSPP